MDIKQWQKLLHENKLNEYDPNKMGTRLYFVIDQLNNAMEFFKDANDFANSIGNQTKYNKNALKKVYDAYWKLNAMKRFHMTTEEYETWLKKFGIGE